MCEMDVSNDKPFGEKREMPEPAAQRAIAAKRFQPKDRLYKFHKIWTVGAAVLALSYPAPGRAQFLTGTATAVDGDTLSVSGRRVRLFGIDAPESDQLCKKDGTNWSCGQVATQQLTALVEGKQVECRGTGVDQYGRILAICRAGPDELNEVMVEQGWAVAYRQYSDNYIFAEDRAKASHLGMWSSTFMLPSDYRHSKLPPAPARAENSRQRSTPKSPQWTGGCLIKGNRSRRGEWIYHLPGMPYYEQTRAEEMFCTEAEAQAAGYRRAIVRQR